MSGLVSEVSIVLWFVKCFLKEFFKENDLEQFPSAQTYESIL